LISALIEAMIGGPPDGRPPDYRPMRTAGPNEGEIFEAALVDDKKAN
jgi:hypothetical protein